MDPDPAFVKNWDPDGRMIGLPYKIAAPSNGGTLNQFTTK